jgi:hypothetical protein
MRRTPPILVACMAFALAGCVLPGKAPKTASVVPVAPKPVANTAPAPPPPSPLSIPQTRVELPRPQPLDPDALVTEATPPPPAEAPPTAAKSPLRRNNAPPKPSEAPPATPPAVAPPAAESERGLLQEIVPATELKRLRDSAQGRRKVINQILEQLKNRSLNSSQRSVFDAITSFVASSVEAENNGDMRQADALAERAQILATELMSGK